MKKLILSIIILLIATSISFAQNEGGHVIAERTSVKVTSIVNKEDAASFVMSAKILKMNRKKNTEIISIKSYRKSLHIKVKTVKMC
jgi:hypothetical protein